MRLRPAVVALTLVLVPGAVFAGKPPAVPAHAHGALADAENGPAVEGRVTSVNFQRGVVTVDTGHGTTDVWVMPTTSVQTDSPGYHTLTDVTRGARVHIDTSRSDGKLVAQIIRLLKR